MQEPGQCGQDETKLEANVTDPGLIDDYDGSQVQSHSKAGVEEIKAQEGRSYVVRLGGRDANPSSPKNWNDDDDEKSRNR